VRGSVSPRAIAPRLSREWSGCGAHELNNSTLQGQWIQAWRASDGILCSRRWRSRLVSPLAFPLPWSYLELHRDRAPANDGQDNTQANQHKNDRRETSAARRLNVRVLDDDAGSFLFRGVQGNHGPGMQYARQPEQEG